MDVPDEPGDQLQVDVLAFRTRQTLDGGPGVAAGGGDVAEVGPDDAFEIPDLLILLPAPPSELAPDWLRVRALMTRREAEVSHFKHVLQVELLHRKSKTCKE